MHLRRLDKKESFEYSAKENLGPNAKFTKSI